MKIAFLTRPMAMTEKTITEIAGIKGSRYVRVTKVLHDKYVEFEFSINDPTIHVELVLPFEHFKIFFVKPIRCSI